MNDDTDKLAAEINKILPSKKARNRGMNAAMAAFDMEFAAEKNDIKNSAQNNTPIEINSASPQGLTDAARPTGQSTNEGFVQIFGRRAMSTLSNIFNMKPKAVMMGSTCMAALLAALVILPATLTDVPLQEIAVKPAQSIAAEPAPIKSKRNAINGERASVEKTLEQIRLLETQTNESAASSPAADNAAAPTPPAPKVQGGITSVNGLLSKVRNDAAQIGLENKNRERAFRQNKNPRLVTFGGQTPQELVNNPVGANASTQKTLSGGYVLEEVPAQYKTETKTIVTKEASTELILTPPTFETVKETVVVVPQSIDYVTIPASYEWVEGEIQGSTVEYETQPAEYETVTEAVVVQEASTELVTIPPTYNIDGTIAIPARTQERVIPSVTKTETRRIVKSPASTVERVVPYKIKDGKTRIPVKPAQVVEKAVPAVTKQVSRRVLKTPARTVERLVPAGTRKEVAVKMVVSPERFYLRNDSGKIIREFESRDAFEKYTKNAVTQVSEKPVSTFSIDVDTASYSFLRAALNRGQLPPPSAIRLEEMINYFPYDYEAPTSAAEPFKANVTVTETPWNADTKLMHIGIKGYVPTASERPRSNLVFLIDTSGSMNQTNKLPLLINSFKLLLNTLGADDTVSIVTYAGSAGTVLEPTAASDKNKINAALQRLRAGGSTAGAAGLELAYQKAQESFDDEGVNRIILATDGDFNVGFSSPDAMTTFIKKKRETGIFLSVLGFGVGNYNDHLMQSLAQNGNGVAAYIDTLSEANKVLANEAGSALFTIAKDVKIQVEFNPDTISEYRLIGYETRALKREDFNNDKVDAGEIGAGHTVTAIYELTPVGSPAKVIDPLRYVTDKLSPKSTGSDELAFVKIRHKLPNADKSTLQTFPIGSKQERSLNSASDDMRFAAAVAAVGQKLRGDTHLADFSYDEAIKLASSAKGEDEHGYRSEFIQLVRLAENLQD